MASQASADPPASNRPTGTVTFLFSDIEGSSMRWERSRAAMQDAVRLHDGIVSHAIASNGGHVFKTAGDAFCAAFALPESAVRAALDAQRTLAATDFSDVDGLRVRMAINTGTADERDGDYFGPAVNRVARVLSLGHGGQVLLSGVAAGLLGESELDDASLVCLGQYVLRDLERRELVYQVVAPGLQREFPALRSHEPVDRPWLVPDAMRTPYFTGREPLMLAVHEQLTTHHRAALSGLGGVGKTQAALAYAVRYRSEYSRGVFWIDAETTSGLTGGFVAVAKALRLPAAESSDQEQAVRAALSWFNENDRWLIVLDNVEDRAEARRFVPDNDNGHVLVTSRQSVFPELRIARAIEVRDLDGAEAARFLLDRTGRDESDVQERDAITVLAAELGNLPLALEQAAAYISETGARFADYLGAFRKRRVSLLKKGSEFIAHDGIATTWVANFEAVERLSPAAADALRISAFLGPDAIPFEIFFTGSAALGEAIGEALTDADALAMSDLLSPLVRYSLIRLDARSRTYSVHRLVLETVRAAMSESESEGYAQRAIEALDAATPDVDFVVWPALERLVPHVVNVAGWIERDEIATVAAGRILSHTGRFLSERGRFAEALELSRKALEIRERVHGPDDLAVAETLNVIGATYLNSGRCLEAQPLLERALAIRERALGPDDTMVARSLNNLANVYYARGQYALAEPLYGRALEIWERALGPNDPDVATALNNLAQIRDELGKYADAEPLQQRALAIRERALGPDHPHVALSAGNLGHTYWAQGRRADAEMFLQRALAVRERVLGPDHTDVAESLQELAIVRESQGRFEEALTMHHRAVSINERAVGRDDALFGRSLRNLANCHAKLNQYDEARSLLEQAIPTLQNNLGPDHSQVASALSDLAAVYAKQGRASEAEALFERALSIVERALAADHPLAVKPLVGRGSLRIADGRTAQGVSDIERALSIKQRSSVPEDPALLEIREALAEAIR